MYVFHSPKDFSFDKVGVKGKIFDSLKLSDKAKFVLIETGRGHKTKILERESTFYYFILEGNGSFEVDGKVEKCNQGDLVVIPNGKAFKYTGKMKMLLVSIPPWRPKQEETIEE